MRSRSAALFTTVAVVALGRAASASLLPLRTSLTFQLVPNPFSTRDSPAHDAIHARISELNASHQRFSTWLPYPRLGVAALEAPSGALVCGFVNGGGVGYPWSTTLDCGSRGGGSIAAVAFASYGTPDGACGSMRANASCDAPGAAARVAAACVGKPACTLASNDAAFGGAPCAGETRLAVAVTCTTPPKNATYWDFTRMDEEVSDFMAASGAGAASVIQDFSTIPQWLFATPDRVRYPDDPLSDLWDYEQGKTLRDPSMRELGDYFGRVAAHYTEGGFLDEGGLWVPGLRLTLGAWEVLNEVEGEHGMSAAYYTQVYDAVLAGIARWAPSAYARMRFFGLALIDSSHVDYVSYFLNRSNHASPGVRIGGVTFHHYAVGAARDGGVGGAAYESFFPSADAWLLDLERIAAVRDALAPDAWLDADETGVILPNDNNPQWTAADPGFPPIYWNAVAAADAYLWASAASRGLDVMGLSALAQPPSLTYARGAPLFANWTMAPQYPSVSLTSFGGALGGAPGDGNAIYWVLRLVTSEFRVGPPSGSWAPADADALDVGGAVPAGSAPALWAQGFVEAAGSGARKVLVVNRGHAPVTATLAGATGGTWRVVDQASGYGPPALTTLSGDSWVLAPFAVGVLRLPTAPM